MFGWMAKIASAYRAANVRPFGDVPACRIAGPFCGERTTLSGPRDLKNDPTCSMRRTVAGSANIPALVIHHDGIGLPALPERPPRVNMETSPSPK